MATPSQPARAGFSRNLNPKHERVFHTVEPLRKSATLQRGAPSCNDTLPLTTALTSSRTRQQCHHTWTLEKPWQIAGHLLKVGGHRCEPDRVRRPPRLFGLLHEPPGTSTRLRRQRSKLEFLCDALGRRDHHMGSTRCLGENTVTRHSAV